MEHECEVACQGWMKKKGSRVNIWGDRYFVLRGPSLFYYLKEKDVEPKGVFALQAACRISNIRADVNKKRNQYLFSIIWPADDDPTHEKQDPNNPKPKRRNSISRSRPASDPHERSGTLVGGGIAA
eukprot:CAMPEP_0182436314 /NCGR_PEP_ID=MMETSP1167-20130531/80852_1 /TAXON_ID=2988 /ORGANISM="Mallomonas Sp, Strain CCMP3275" /LENGTH=125 /DNA_ID=CAMNT_0024628349 /DNA_START=15 /DNA_END=388 /DNA_ORIENTATION=+